MVQMVSAQNVVRYLKKMENFKGEMPLTFDEDILEIEQISSKEYNVNTINSIKHLYPNLRQRSKAP